MPGFAPPVHAYPAAAQVKQLLETNEGILRLAPCWVPRSFLMPGRRLRLHPDDYYALGAHRGGIDERWFASTTPAANEGAPPDEGLSYIVDSGQRQFTLKEAIALEGAALIGPDLWSKYSRWPVYSKFFDNQGPIPHHLHQSDEQAAKVGRQGKPESYYFPPQYNPTGNSFPYTFMGLEPGVTKPDLRRCLERWSHGENGILDLSKAYRLKVGTGWLIPPCILHAPGSLLTYEPQWGSDVFAMYQSMVEGRVVPWGLLVKDVPTEKHQDLDYLVEQLDWEANLNPRFKASNYLEPLAAADNSGDGYADRWVVYGRVHGRQLFSAKELTVQPGKMCVLKDPGAYGMLAVQGSGTVGQHAMQTPTLIRYGELTSDELFVAHDAARSGVAIANTGSEPFVTLRYFGPDAHAQMPNVGDRSA